MALSHFVLFQPPLQIDTPAHWFMMQVGIILGFFTAWPVNRRLVRSGIKEKMDHRTHLAMLIERRAPSADEEARDEPVAREREADAPAIARGGSDGSGFER